MIFVTSDQHFGHKGIIRLVNRPFQSVDEMNQRMIDLWNAVVSNDDTVYVLGDFIGRCHIDKDKILQIGSSLKGNKILLEGNHDKNYEKQKIFEKVYSSREIVDLRYRDTLFYMNHFLTNMTVSEDLPSVVYLHGHIHHRIGYNMINTYYRRPYYDVGVDANYFAPVSLDRIIDFFANPPKNAPRVRCKLCGGHMEERQGPWGKFLGCSCYPNCKFTINLDIDRRSAKEKQEYHKILNNNQGHNH